MKTHLLVLAKTPVPGRVKTRLCPPHTPAEAALIAAAALADTLDAVSAAAASRRTLVVEGDHPAPRGWGRLTQRGDGLPERLANAYLDTLLPGVPAMLIGMDTPQVSPGLLDAATAALARADTEAVLGPAADGGWWALGLRAAEHAHALRDVPTSTGQTGARTLAALRERGLRVTLLPELRDVDTAADAIEVAALCPPESRFATVLRAGARGKAGTA